jgi:hypothetical protein
MVKEKINLAFRNTIKEVALVLIAILKVVNIEQVVKERNFKLLFYMLTHFGRTCMQNSRLFTQCAQTI